MEPITPVTPPLHRTQPINLPAKVRIWLAAALHGLAAWRQRARSRQHLARLNERQLADLGISLAERSAEVDKPFWR